MNTSDEHKSRTKRGYTIEVATISSSRYRDHEGARNPSEADDVSGAIIVDALQDVGHTARYSLLPDDISLIREWLEGAVAGPDTDAIITTGGTGLAPAMSRSRRQVRSLRRRFPDSERFSVQRASMRSDTPRC